MPLYDYQCNECGEVFELMVRFSEPARPRYAQNARARIHRKSYPLSPHLRSHPLDQAVQPAVAAGPRDIPEAADH